MDKPFSQACENNKQVILDELVYYLRSVNHVLEIGSGTGQHAVHFAGGLPHVIWQCADHKVYHAGINAWIDDSKLTNIRRPFEFQIGTHHWPSESYDAIFSANTAHIMQKHEVKLMMEMIATHLPRGGVFCQYGPFTHKGEFSSQSNHDFHHHLLTQGYGGYRDIDELTLWAKPLVLAHIIEMPANNLLLVWRK